MILLIFSLSQGDWRLLHLLAHNMNPIVFAEFVIELELQVVSLELDLKCKFSLRPTKDPRL